VDMEDSKSYKPRMNTDQTLISIRVATVSIRDSFYLYLTNWEFRRWCGGREGVREERLFRVRRVSALLNRNRETVLEQARETA